MTKKAPVDPDPDLELGAPDIEAAPEKKGGLFRSLFRLVTLPFRLVAGVVKAIVAIAVLLVRILLFPIMLGIKLVKGIVDVAADLTYGLWRLVMKLVGFVVGSVMFVFGVLNATIGGAIRLVFRVVFGSLKLVVRVLTLGKLFGKAKATVDEDAPPALEAA